MFLAQSGRLKSPPRPSPLSGGYVAAQSAAAEIPGERLRAHEREVGEAAGTPPAPSVALAALKMQVPSAAPSPGIVIWMSQPPAPVGITCTSPPDVSLRVVMSTSRTPAGSKST